jgi:hypothetical protein
MAKKQERIKKLNIKGLEIKNSTANTVSGEIKVPHKSSITVKAVEARVDEFMKFMCENGVACIVSTIHSNGESLSALGGSLEHIQAMLHQIEGRATAIAMEKLAGFVGFAGITGAGLKALKSKQAEA